jgi:hypothetical protein
MTSEDAIAFDRHLGATAPAVADIARALRLAVLAGFPEAVETFDRGDGLLAFGTGRSMRDFRFAITPHRPTSITSWPTARACRSPTGGSRAPASGSAT